MILQGGRIKKVKGKKGGKKKEVSVIMLMEIPSQVTVVSSIRIS